MKAAPLLRLSVSTTPGADAIVAELLTEVFGVPASIHTDLERGVTLASVYLDWRPPRLVTRRRTLVQRLHELRVAGLNLGTARVSVRKIRREDWAQAWKRHFRPLLIGQSLLIKPSWSRRRPKRSQALVVIDPGLSFGTGQHPTTRFCLQQLVAAREAEVEGSLLDLGTGSGILAVAAACLGYAPVVALDSDPQAVRVARGNAESNGVRAKIRFIHEDLARFRSRGSLFDVVCANLIDDLLVREARRILACVRPGGLLVLAGILRRHFPSVIRAYAAGGARLVRRQCEGEWESGSFRNPVADSGGTGLRHR